MLFVSLSAKTSITSFKSKIQSLSKLKTKGWSSNYFLGFWIGTGYSCEGVDSIPEDVNVHYTNTDMVAVKVKGTPCVYKGETTFTSKLVDVWRGDIPCVITLGTPEEPQSVHSDKCTIQIIDINNFKFKEYAITFRRGRLPQDSYSMDFFKGVWYGVGYSCGDKTGLTQEIDIQYEGGKLLATKLQGDDCVNQLQITFKIILQETFVRRSDKSWKIPCSLHLGTEDNPQSYWSNDCNINIIDDNNFEIPQFGLTYKRKVCDTSTVTEIA